MPKRIEKLSLAGFRGATSSVEIPFDPTKQISLIFGENGSGKSSVVDAFDFVCNQRFGSIEEKHDVTPKEQVISLKRLPKDLKVSLKISGELQPWVAALDQQGNPVIKQGQGSPPRARILRRKQILKVIDEPPARRYEALKDFISFPGIDSAELALRKCIQEIEDDYNHSASAKGQAEATLTGLWIEEKKPGTDALAWAKGRASEDAASLRTNAADIKNIVETLGTAQKDVDAYALSVKVRNDEEGKFQKAEQAVKALETAAKEADLIDLLKSAQKYLPQAAGPEECPLCERPGIEVAALLKRIAARLAEMNRTALLKTVLETAKKAYEASITTNTNIRATLIRSAWSLARVLHASKVPEVAALNLDWSKFPDIRLETLPAETDEVFYEAQKLQLSAKACLDPLKKRHESVNRALNLLGTLQREFAVHQENAQKATEAEAQLKRAQAILAVIEKRRKDFTDKVLTDISDDVGTLCETIHPGEGIKVRFFLDPRFRNSLKSLGEFSGVKDVPPQAYYSESHLDTIGVCIFLALAKRFGGTDEIIVLDDVLTSVDAPHLDRFMNLLVSQAEHFRQVIVASHYRPWLERFRHAQGPSANIHTIELYPWGFERGITHGKIKLAVGELRDILKATPLDRQAVASKAGVFLEGMLEHLASLYHPNMPVKLKRPYSLDEWLSAFSKEIRTSLKIVRHSEGVARSEVALKTLIDDVAGSCWKRNQAGAHWNAEGFNIPDGEIADFAQKVLTLADALICAQCGALPVDGKSGTHWDCHCKGSSGLQLFPLKSTRN